MLSGAADIKGRVGATGPAVLLLLLAVLTLVASDRLSQLEASFYDFLQRQQHATGSDRVVLLDTRANGESDADAWEPERLRDIIDALNAAGARSIVAAETPPVDRQLPDVSRLAALVELQRRTGRAGSEDSANSLARQLESIQRQYEQQEAIETLVRETGNFVLALPGDGSGSAGADRDRDCESHAIRLGDGQSGAVLSDLRTIGGQAGIESGFCRAAANAGVFGFWPDADRVVRRTNLLINAGGLVYPALALAGALGQAAGGLQVSDADRLSIAGNEITTGPGFTSLNRFYTTGDDRQPFTTIGVDALLAGEVPEQIIRDRIIVLGPVSGPGTLEFRTPVNPQVPAATLLATSLSNLLEGDYLLRPAWLHWAELALFALLGAAIFVSIPRMSARRAAVAAVCLATVLLAAEGYLFMAQGVWVQLVVPALFALFGIGLLQALRMWLGQTGPAAAMAGAAAANAPSRPDELDLAFSVLRQQPPTDETKEKLYKIAATHGKNKEFAKAERVMRHLASIDPDYRNVGEKLRRLSGARLGKNQAQVAPATERAPAAPLPKKRRGPIRTLGRYEVERVLGRGAMATVYLGRDPAINRKVAIKTIALSEEFSDEDLESARQQFMREAESAGRLNHPNIIAIYDAGEDEGVAYLAMEYFEGKALSEHAQSDNLLPPKWVLELMARAAEALHYAHGQKVVHRDIKPANLMYDAAADSLKITDFGIARLTDTSRTKTGIILGTPSYMSPEQLAAETVTGRSDLYSLGITMYQLLAGTAPFRADSIPKLMDKIVNDRHRPLTGIRDGLPPCIDDILEQALAKNPEDRFANGRAMAMALRECCNTFG